MAKDDPEEGWPSLANPADVSFSDEGAGGLETTAAGSGEDEINAATKSTIYSDDEAEEAATEDDEWRQATEARAPGVGKTPFYRRPPVAIALLALLFLGGFLVYSLSSNSKKKTVQFAPAPPIASTPAQVNQFSQPAPAVPGGVNNIPPTVTGPTPEQPAPAAGPVAGTTPIPVVSAATTGPPTTNTVPAVAGPVVATTVPVAATQRPADGGGPTAAEMVERRMREELQALNERINALQRENRQLAAKVEKMSKKQVATKTPDRQASAPAAVVQQPTPPAEVFSIKAIRKGQAWIASSSGGTYTVNVGDMLPGNVRVTGIDPDNLEVNTSAGLIRYKK